MQAGITPTLNSLEDEVAFSLFIRSKKGVQLTETSICIGSTPPIKHRAEHRGKTTDILAVLKPEKAITYEKLL